MYSRYIGHLHLATDIKENTCINIILLKPNRLLVKIFSALNLTILS